MIYTSYFAKMNKLPGNVIPIAISLTVPKDVTCLRCKILAPSGALLKCYKTEENVEVYTKLYTSGVLNKLTVKTILNALYQLLPANVVMRYDLDPDTWYMSNEVSICLMCWERSDKFCHRHLVRGWLNSNNVPCIEYIY